MPSIYQYSASCHLLNTSCLIERNFMCILCDFIRKETHEKNVIDRISHFFSRCFTFSSPQKKNRCSRRWLISPWWYIPKKLVPECLDKVLKLIFTRGWQKKKCIWGWKKIILGFPYPSTPPPCLNRKFSFVFDQNISIFSYFRKFQLSHHALALYGMFLQDSFLRATLSKAFGG